MPTASVSSLAKKAGKSASKGEELWKKAKAQAEKQGRGSDYAYITGIYKKMLGLNEADLQMEATVSGAIPASPNPLELIGPFTEKERRQIVRRMQGIFPGATEEKILSTVFGSQRGELSEAQDGKKAFEKELVSRHLNKQLEATLDELVNETLEMLYDWKDNGQPQGDSRLWYALARYKSGSQPAPEFWQEVIDALEGWTRNIRKAAGLR